jgi:hypothetical protein
MTADAGPMTLLFLAANPLSRLPLALGEEVRAIETALRASDLRDIQLVSRWAVRPDDLQQHLDEQRPALVHFSGHGSDNGELVLHAERGEFKYVTPTALASLFRPHRNRVRVVFLNACDSLLSAEAIVEEIECVIAMSERIGDKAARVFSPAFYRALGFGYSVGAAFEQGRTALQLAGIDEEHVPRLLERDGVSADQVSLRSPAPPHPPAAALARVCCVRCGATPDSAARCAGLAPAHEFGEFTGVVFCRDCGAAASRTRVACTGGRSSHRFVAAAAPPYCRRCGRQAGVRSQCGELSAQHEFLSAASG